jgi:hypothetical protein
MAKKTSLKAYLRWLSYVFLSLILALGIAFGIAYIKRDEIRDGIMASLNENINGTITIENVRFTIIHQFPDFSISLHDVTVKDTAGIAALQAERIFLNVGFLALFENEIHLRDVSVERGNVFIYNTRNGQSNLSVFKKKTGIDSASGQPAQKKYSLNIRDIRLRDLAFLLVDSTKNKKFSFNMERTVHTMKQEEKFVELWTKGRIRCYELTFNAEAGSFLKSQAFAAELRINYDRVRKALNLLPSTLQLEEDLIKIDGEFLPGDSATFALHIQSDDLMLQDGMKYVNDRIKARLSQFSVDRPVGVDVRLQGRMGRGNQPQADVSFSVSGANVTYQKLRMQAVNCTGQYLHRQDSAGLRDENSKVVISQFQASLEGIPFEGKVSFSKLYDPVMDLSARSGLTAAMLNKLVDTTEWVSRSGSFRTSIRYSGRLEEYLDTNAPRYYGKLSGDFQARNAAFDYKPKKFTFRNLNGHCSFSEKQFTIDNLTFSVNGNTVTMKGMMRNYIPFFIQPANKGIVTLELTSPRLDLSFIAAPAKTGRNIKGRRLAAADKEKINSVLNTVQRKLQFEVKLSASELIFKKFSAQNVNGLVRLDGDILEASDVRMSVAGGEMSTRLFFRSDDSGRKFIAANTEVKDANIRDFFTMFNDFNQKTILGRNLEGKVSTTANFSAEVLPDYSIDAESMKGNLSCRISDGRLIDFEPLENLSNFLFKKRDFSDVHFAELESYFDINGTDIDIERMEVQSSVLSFFIQGRYSFTDTTSMSLQLPLSNLKKRDRDYTPENVGTDGKQGMSVYLHVYRDKDINSRIKFAYDPFKKWARQISGK